MNTETYGTLATLKAQFALSKKKVNQWVEQGALGFERKDARGMRYFKLADVKKLVESDNKKIVICYARVASEAEEEKLEVQVALLAHQFPTGIIMREIGGNYDNCRPVFDSILKMVLDGTVSEVVVTSWDRFGCDSVLRVVRMLFNHHNTTLTAMSPTSSISKLENQQDLLQVAETIFARNDRLKRENLLRQKRLRADEKRERQTE